MDDRSASEPAEIPEELIHLVKPELQPGERLLWASRAGLGPAPASLGPSAAALTWFFGFAAAGVGCFIPLAAGGKDRLEGAGALLAIIAVLSAIIVFFFIFGSMSNYFSKRAERRKLEGQIYALTDRRAVIWIPAERSAVTVHTFQRGTIRGDALHRVQYPDGSGDVLLQGNHYMGASGSGFFGIADVRRVEELVRRFLVNPSTTAKLAGQTPDPDLF